MVVFIALISQFVKACKNYLTSTGLLFSSHTEIEVRDLQPLLCMNPGNKIPGAQAQGDDHALGKSFLI